MNFLPSILKKIEIVMSNFFYNIKPRFFLNSGMWTSQEQLYEKGVLLSKESVMGMAAVLDGELAHLRNGR